jgi:hypothetical protein
MGEEQTTPKVQTQDDIKAKFLEYFHIPEKRNQLGLYEVHNKVLGGPKVIRKFKSITALEKWCYNAAMTLEENDKF